jgi:hypothetical protein
VLTGIVTLALGSYLAMTSNENQLVMRSRCWNAALPLAEAGVEEAFSHINKNASDYAADGWNVSGTNYSKQRYLGNDYYTVTVSGAPGGNITVTSTGFVQSVSYGNHGTYNSVDTGYVPRAVQVVANMSSIPAAVGLVAKSTLSFGGNLGVDSYDTSNLATSSTNKSATGMYDSSKRSAAAFVGCVSTAPLALGGNEHIYGYAASGVGTLYPTAQGSASIGDLTVIKGAQTGHVTNNFSMILPDVVAPFSSANAPSSGTGTNKIHSRSYDYVLKGGNYIVSSLSGMNLYVSDSSVLYVTGDATAGSITFAASTNAGGTRLDLYVGGTTVPHPDLYNELADGSFTQSAAVAPVQFRVLGLNNCTTFNLNGGAFVGVLYAPHVNMTCHGNANVYGAFTVDSFSCNGNFDFHYDLALKNEPSIPTLKIVSWAEE